MTKEKEWYVIHTYSGHENKVKANLEKRIAATGMQDKIFRVLVPTEERVETKQGKKKVVNKKIFPGYVLVEMIMTEETWYIVRNTPGVTGFISSGTKPLPLPEDEVKEILKSMGIKEARPEINFEKGQSVKITDGPFEEFIGVVQEIYPERGKVKVLVSMFGRETPLELDFNQVEEV
ncbi:transcription termination/antitermination protein NusG [Anoxybacter fermentans]|uniref:Transcription termination/antitermination protein NusG n=1 Tax=Anoxybacter fermentans TaxID=1323375 RepID=A0A3Q9HSK0_9FIRM|nr:transcription termination/antitermination protein NusG [Anoxybacter fermentans]AZR74706.1 transcription termination/antitermination protein NusG [Anoxybacter fermentans]